MNIGLKKEYFKEWIFNNEIYIPGKTEEGFIKLSSNENNYGPSEKVLKILYEKAKFVNKYPYKSEILKEKICQYIKKTNNINLNQKNIILGNGSDEIIQMIIMAFKSPYFSYYPTFPEYKILSRTFNEKYYDCPLNHDFSFNFERFIEEKNFKNANLIFLATPNNPTGTIIEQKYIKEILDYGKIVVVDEAYYEFSKISVVDLIHDYENLIVLRTFSKAFGLSGLRIGYGISNEKIIEALHKVKQPFNVNLLAQECAIAALQDLKYMLKVTEKIIEEREKLYKILSKRFKVFTSYGNFLFVDVSPYTAEEFFKILYNSKIIIRPLGKFIGFDGNYVRITVGTEEENKKLIDILTGLK